MLSRNSRHLAVACFVLTLTAGGIWLAWPTAPNRRTAPAPSSPAGSRSANLAASSVTKPAPPTNAAQATVGALPIAERAGAPLIDAVLKDQTLDNAGAARALGVLVQDTSLKLDSREMALTHMLNLSAGNEAALLLPLLKSQNLPDSLASTILNDALNGPLTWQAEACLAIMARKTGQELHTQASEHLAFLTGEEHGDDVTAWALAVRKARVTWEATAP